MGRKRFSRTKNRKYELIQCKYCINVLHGEARYARHILTRHPEHVNDYIHGKAR